MSHKANMRLATCPVFNQKIKIWSGSPKLLYDCTPVEELVHSSTHDSILRGYPRMTL
jgi:hypothetical protein